MIMVLIVLTVGMQYRLIRTECGKITGGNTSVDFRGEHGHHYQVDVSIKNC